MSRIETDVYLGNVIEMIRNQGREDYMILKDLSCCRANKPINKILDIRSCRSSSEFTCKKGS